MEGHHTVYLVISAVNMGFWKCHLWLCRANMHVSYLFCCLEILTLLTTAFSQLLESVTLIRKVRVNNLLKNYLQG